MTIDLNMLVLLGIAVMNAYTAYAVNKTHNLALKTELNTNSMKDALVKATGIAAHAEGREEGRLQSEADALSKTAQSKSDQ